MRRRLFTDLARGFDSFGKIIFVLVVASAIAYAVGRLAPYFL